MMTEEEKQETIEVPVKEWEALKQEVAENKDKYLRALAEIENARKRLQKERLEAIQYATGGVLADFLHPMDNLENALKSAEKMSPEIKNWALGFEMILGQFKEVLSQHGVSAINAEGQEFDPHLHEAVEIVESTEHTPGTVIQEFSRGYTLGKRTIRPARVKVAKAPAELNTNNEENNNESKE